MVDTHLYLLRSCDVGVLGRWRNILPHRDIARLLSLVQLKENMNNPYLTVEEINKAFHEVYLEENYNFLEEDLQNLADGFIMAAMPAIVKTERDMCVKFVNSLNTNVARALGDYRENL